jgi:hypothetical protein
MLRNGLIESEAIKCPFGQPGDVLWVRETWADKTDVGLLYRADLERCNHPYLRGGCVWKPSIHMPRWASRLTLEIISVRVEKLQEITARECIKEGWLAESIKTGNDEQVFKEIRESPIPCMMAAKLLKTVGKPPRQWFAELWDSINGKGAWEKNPWVWRIEFRRKEDADGQD